MTSGYRAELEGLYMDAPRKDDCHVCGLPLAGDSTIEHVPAMALVRERGAFGPMIRTRSHRACNRGMIEE